MIFPFTYGDSISSDYEGHGLYCGHNGIEETGTVYTVADGIGTLYLTEEDTLHNVLRIHVVKTSSIRMDKDSFVTPPTSHTNILEESYLWYARGYRYPVFETHKETYYHGTKYMYVHKTAYRTLPKTIRSLGDSINEVIIRSDSIKTCSDGKDIIQYQVSHSGNIIRIDYRLRESASISAIVSDTMGIVYRRYNHTEKPGDGLYFTFDMNGLRRGEYILYLNVNGMMYSHTVHKN